MSALIGRAQEEAAIAEVFDRSAGGLLIFGDPGTGKTSLLARAATMALERDWQVERRSVPAGVPDPQNVLESLPAPTGSAGFVVCVDNAHLLNAASAAALYSAVTSDRAVMVATLLMGAPAPEPLVSLWKDDLCGRRDLAPLDRPAADDMTRFVLGGLVDGTTLARLWRLTRGNPLYLRELITAGLDGGELARHRGVWQWQGRMAPTGRLLQLVDARIGARSADERDALDLVAIGEPLSPDALDRAGADPAALATLERAGLVEVAEVGRRMLVRTTHPMIGAAVRASAGALRTRGLQRRLAVAWSAFDGRADDALRLAAAMIGSGDQPASRDALLGGTVQASSHRDLLVMERTARAAVESGGGVFAAAQLGEALAWQGRHEEAEELLASYAAQAVTDSEHVAIAGRRAAILRWGLDRPEDAWEVLRSVEAALSDRSAWPGVVALRQRFLTLDEAALAPSAAEARSRLANERACIRLSTDHWDRVISSSLVTRVFALVAGGRVAEAIAHAEGRHGEDEDSVPEQARPLHREALSYGLCLAHLADGNVAEAKRVAEAGYQRTTDRQGRLYAAMWAGCLGEVAFLRGRMRESLHRMQEAVATASVTPQPHAYALLIEHLALTGVVRAAALLRDVATAEAAFASRAALAPLPPAVMTNWTGDHVVWLEVARGNGARAVELALTMAKECAARQLVGFELGALHLAARLGGAQEAAVMLRAAAAGTGGQLPVDGEWNELAILHIQALARQDAATLDALSQRFADLGAMLLAAESAGAASLAYGRTEPDERAAALDAAARAHRWARQCEGAQTPTLISLLEPQSLTPRQREIARLVISGMQSRDIAAHLVLSVRTVDNALGVIYRKLGVRSRQELAVLLEPFDLGDEPVAASTGTRFTPSE